MDHEGAPPSGIEVVNAVEDLAPFEVEREGEQNLEVFPSANVNDTNHPDVAPSFDEELTQVKRQCDKLKEALTFQKEQRQILKDNFISSSKGNFDFRKEITRLQKENARLAATNPSEEDRFTVGELEP
jgi:septal ring factor EnvC (AmiA/AmiB activator)